MNASTITTPEHSILRILRLAQCDTSAVDQRCFAFARQLRQQPLFTEPTTGGKAA